MPKNLLREIESTLKTIYQLDHSISAESFMVTAHHSTTQGSVFVSNKNSSELNVAIYLSKDITETLENFSRWTSPWSRSELNALSVATEELSHFHYLIQSYLHQKSVSLFELEIQGDIDRFVVLYFLYSSYFRKEPLFPYLFSELFEKFSLKENLSKEERDRYIEANHLSSHFIQKLRSHFDHQEFEKLRIKLKDVYSKSSLAKANYLVKL